MKEPPAKLYFDEDVSDILAAMLRGGGLFVATTGQLGRKGKSDSDQLEYAAQNGFVILTHNRNDYEVLAVKYFEDGRSHNGIILSVRRPASEIANRLRGIVESFSANEMINQVVYI